MKTLSKLLRAKNNLIKNKGIIPYAFVVHPDADPEITGLTTAHGMKVIVPSKSELLFIATFLGVDSKSKEFWDKDTIFILDEEGYNNLVGKNLEQLEIKE